MKQMIPEEFYLKSFDHKNLYAIRWSTHIRPDAVIAFVHGLGDHSRRYDDWFLRFTQRNMAVVALDLRGHGQSFGRRGMINGLAEFRNDIEMLLTKTRELYPDIPLILYGHSMGATLTISYLLRSAKLPDLAVATSPWIGLIRKPGRLFMKIIHLASLAIPFATFQTGLQASDFSINEGFEEKREHDPYVHNRISPRLFTEVECEVNWIKQNFNQLKTPMLLLQGGDDRIMDPRQVRQMAEGASGQVNYREWKNAGHQLHNSDCSDEVFEYLTDWIKEGCL